jgi:hypothetical protein
VSHGTGWRQSFIAEEHVWKTHSIYRQKQRLSQKIQAEFLTLASFRFFSVGVNNEGFAYRSKQIFLLFLYETNCRGKYLDARVVD